MGTHEIEPDQGSKELSKVPSWILLGFLIGAAFVFLLRREYIFGGDPAPTTFVEPIPPPAPAASPTSLTALEGEPSLSAIEAIWMAWGEHAVWIGELSEVAMWNTQNLAFSDYVEVTRRGESYFFRSIPKLTRPIVDRGLGIRAPIQFTGPPKATAGRP